MTGMKPPRTASQDLRAHKASLMDKVMKSKGNQAYDDESTQMLSSMGSVSLPSTVLADQPTIISSSCSSSASSASRASSVSSTGSATSAYFSDEGSASLLTMDSGSAFESATESYYDEFEGEEDDEDFTLAASTFVEEDKEIPVERASTMKSMQSDTSTSTTKLSMELDSVLKLVRLGKNASLRRTCQLPFSISKSDIHVKVDIDQQLKRGEFGESVRIAIQDDLRDVYSATSETAKLFLCVVIVVMSDGSLFGSMADNNQVMGLAEIGLVWRLFEADDLTVYDGGVVVKSQDILPSIGLFDLFVPMGTRGRQFILSKLAPRVANDIMSRIADSNDELMMEI